jgi:ankyrin repeat protein
MNAIDNPLAAFIDAACVPLDSGHGSGTLDQANAILAAHPEIATQSVHTAAILGDDVAVRRFLDADRASATAKGGPRDWDALTHLCFSRYLRLDRVRWRGFFRSANALLEAGANANTGWFESNHQPKPVWESAIYGAAGIAHNAELTHLLLEHGADPNDDETPYHAAETWDNGAVKVLLDSRKLTAENLALMLIRKHDWHDYDGAKLMLEYGADPNLERFAGFRALHHAIVRDNDIDLIDLLLDHGADPTLLAKRPGPANHAPAPTTAVVLAARKGRADVLASFARRGIPTELDEVDGLIAACARNDAEAVRSISEREPRLVSELVAEGGTLLSEFAGTGNTEGVGRLLDLGVDIRALYGGDPYFDIAPNSTALHVAAWRACHKTVERLIARGAPVDALDGKGRSPLALAVRACVDSYWSDRRSPDSVAALLRAGASARGVAFPSGYAEVDELLRPHVPAGG